MITATSNWLDEMRESWLNGNRTSVLAEISKLPKQEAMYAAARMHEMLTGAGGQDHYESSLFMRMLGDRLEW